jgi:uncharacterized membrane protein
MIALTLLAQLLGLGAGLIAGIFLAFSDFVMPGLDEAGPGGGADAMRGLNRTVYKSIFLVLLKALVPLALALAVAAFLFGRPGMAIWLGLGMASHVGPVLLVTGLRNIPMNNRLQSLASDPDGTSAYWPQYVERWSGWNHVRTAGAVLTCACFLLAALA